MLFSNVCNVYVNRVRIGLLKFIKLKVTLKKMFTMGTYLTASTTFRTGDGVCTGCKGLELMLNNS